MSRWVGATMFSALATLLLYDTARCQCWAPDLIGQYEGSQLTLRRAVNRTRVFYLNDSAKTYYHFTDGRSYLYGFDQPVTVDSIVSAVAASWEKPTCRTVMVHFSNQLLGSRTFIIASELPNPLSESQFVRAMTTAFKVDPDRDTLCLYALSRQSGLIHSALCDHLPTGAVALQCELNEGDSARLCTACFTLEPQIPDYALEMQIGQLAAEDYLVFNVAVQDPELERRVIRAGQQALTNWPMALRGYQYHFIAVESDRANAFATPGGTIFVTTALLRALESDDELLAVMAHEIAHVELRHGLRQFHSAQKAKAIGAIAAAIAGAAVGAASDDATVGILAAGAAAVIGDLFSEIAIKGYSQEYELESDQVASLLMADCRNDKTGYTLGQVLKKLRYLKGEAPYQESKSAFSTHPPVSERLLSLNSGELSKFDSTMAYEAFDKQGRRVATLTLRAIQRMEYWGPPEAGASSKGLPVKRFRVICFADIQTTPYMQEPSKLKHIEFKGVKGRLDNEQDTEIIPGQGTGIVFYYDEKEPYNFAPGNELKMELRNVAYCSRSFASKQGGD